MARYWLRTVRGLEWLAAVEASLAGNLQHLAIGHRDVYIESDALVDPASLRCPDDVFLFWASISNLNHTRDMLRELSLIVSRLPPLPVVDRELDGVHVTASFLGERNFSRVELEA